MSRMRNAVLPVTLLVAVLALSACASKPKESPVAAPAPVEAVVEQPAAPVVEAAAAPAPAVVTEQQAPVAAPVQAAPPAKKKVVKAKRKVAPPAPVVEPEPVVQQEAPVVLPPPPAVITQPLPKAEEPGFLEQYWLWLLGLIVAGIAAWWFTQRNKR